MSNRLELDKVLKEIGGKNVYYQPPENTSIKYPAVIYSRDNINNTHADDSVYKQDDKYSIMVISKQVDDPIIDKISKLSGCQYDRNFIKDNLYHTSFSIYY